MELTTLKNNSEWEQHVRLDTYVCFVYLWFLKKNPCIFKFSPVSCLVSRGSSFSPALCLITFPEAFQDWFWYYNFTNVFHLQNFSIPEILFFFLKVINFFCYSVFVLKENPASKDTFSL